MNERLLVNQEVLVARQVVHLGIVGTGIPLMASTESEYEITMNSPWSDVLATIICTPRFPGSVAIFLTPTSKRYCRYSSAFPVRSGHARFERPWDGRPASACLPPVRPLLRPKRP